MLCGRKNWKSHIIFVRRFYYPKTSVKFSRQQTKIRLKTSVIPVVEALIFQK